MVLTGWLVSASVLESRSQSPIVLNATNGPDSSWMNRDIPAVALGKKKFNLRRRLYQNLITRFNAYYNAHTKLAEVVASATAAHQNNYDSLLTLFPYAAADFSGTETNLDSVIYNASYGIEVHDPRGKWIDNLYLIAGQAYFYKQDYHNAIAAFKYIIKQLGPKDEEGAPGIIGTRGYTSEAQISVATPEQKKLLSHTPSRNDAYIWLVRAYIDSGAYDLARNLLSTLDADPAFPTRLHTDLVTMHAWFYFSQGLVDQGIPFVARGVDSLSDRREKARWEFLLGQYYEQKGRWTESQLHFNRVTHLPADPVMHFYAYLNMTEMHILEKQENFSQGSEPLLAMARKEKYERYRSIIYYNLGKMALKSGLPEQAIPFLVKSLHYNRENTAQTALSTRLLADTYFSTGHYREAAQYYDSASIAMDPSAPGYGEVKERRDALADVVVEMDIIGRQDSVQQLAALPKDELIARLKEIVDDSLRARRRRNLILREPAAGAMAGLSPADNPTQTQEGSSPKDWYFYNNSLKATGFNLFRNQWGKRQLQDNWRTKSGSGKAVATGIAKTDSAARRAHAADSGELTVETLLAGLPLEPEQKKTSDDSIREALFSEACIFYDELGEDSISLSLLQQLTTRFPDTAHAAEIAYRLSLIYAHLGDSRKAAFFRNQVTTNFGASKYAAALRQAPRDTAAPMERLIAGIYDSAYLSYLGGQYDRTLQLKDSATRIDPTNRQKARFDLLGAMVLLKQQSDSAGKIALQQITDRDAADTGIAQQARTILNALNHKQELIEHLAHLQLPEEDTGTAVTAAAPKPAQPVVATPQKTIPPPVSHPPVAAAPPVQMPPRDSARDTVKAASPPAPPRTPYKLSAQEPHFVVLAFNRTDKRLIDESLNRFSAYNQQNHLKDRIEVSSYLLGRNQVVLIFRLFPNEVAALTYYREIAAKATSAIIPDIPPAYYRFFIISRDNFILLNSSKDYNGYLEFFSKNYRQF